MEQTDCFVSGALGAILRVSRFFGIAPLRFAKNKNGWRVSVCPRFSYIGYFFLTLCNLMVLWSLIAAMIYIQNIVTIRTTVSTETPAWKVTEMALWHLQFFMLIATASAMVYKASKYMSCVIIWVNQVQKINSDMNIRHWPSQYDKTQIGLLILWVIANTAVTVNDYVAMLTSVALSEAGLWIKMPFALFYVYYWVIQFDIIQYVLVLLHVKSSFKAVTASLRNLLQDDTEKMQHKHKAVHHISFAYMSACDVVRDVNRCYGLKMSMLVVSYFSYLVITSYYIITHLVSYLGELDESYQGIYLMGQCVWCLLHAITLAMIIEPCHLTHKEMKITKELISELLCNTNSINDPMAVELDQFLKLITLNEVTYRPLMVMSMARSLVVEILASITTYLVIVIEIK